jgi:flagellar biosynthesis protein FlhA
MAGPDTTSALGESPFSLKKILKHGDIALALGIIGILLVLLFPVPTIFLDILLAFSIAISVLILMNCLFINKPLDFSVFPTVLLVTAILRLSLNIASTRLILSNGHTGTAAAGHVIEAFGSFVMEGNIVIGVIVFIILTIINFVVITKGSGRIAEVAARFSLDAMPGKQMAIDADLSAGLIDEAVAKSRRKELEDESTFFGAMDGANKFVRGDAIAGILITFINFIAGIIIGVVQRNLTFDEALHTYTTLTIGDGLVSQMPSIVISLAAGLLVSKSGVVGSTDKAIFGQLGKYPQALGLCSVLTMLMAIMPGLPAIPFLIIAVASGSMAWAIKEQAKEAKLKPTPEQQKVAEQEAAAKATEEPISETLHIDSIRLELGYSLLPLINYEKGHRLTEQIKALRKQIAKDLGFVMPSVRIQDNMQLGNNAYVIKIKDIECGKGEVKPEMLLTMDPKGQEISIPGEKTVEPAFGLPAMWISEVNREEALFHGYTVVDPPTVITTHLTEIIKENITELLSYSETQKLIDEISEDHKKLASDTVPGQISVSGLQRVLQSLLGEMVSIRDLPTILEAISEVAKATSSLVLITEHVRTRLARQICHANTNDEGYMPIITLSPAWEQVFSESLVGSGEEKQLSLAPSKMQEFIASLRKVFDEQALKGHLPVLLVSPRLRPYIRSIIERFRPSTVVMSQNEIHPKAKIKTLAQL